MNGASKRFAAAAAAGAKQDMSAEEVTPSCLAQIRVHRITYTEPANTATVGVCEYIEDARDKGQRYQLVVKVNVTTTSGTIEDQKLLVMRVFRPALSSHVLELPGGFVPAGSTLQNEAKKEVKSCIGVDGAVVATSSSVYGDPEHSNKSSMLIFVETEVGSSRPNLIKLRSDCQLISMNKLLFDLREICANETCSVHSTLYTFAAGLHLGKAAASHATPSVSGASANSSGRPAVLDPASREQAANPGARWVRTHQRTTRRNGVTWDMDFHGDSEDEWQTDDDDEDYDPMMDVDALDFDDSDDESYVDDEDDDGESLDLYTPDPRFWGLDSKVLIGSGIIVGTCLFSLAVLSIKARWKTQ